MNQVKTGKIVYLKKDKAYGFIKPEDATAKEDNIFFHKNDLVSVKFEDLEPNNIVEYEVKETSKGLNAINVVVR